MLDLTFGEQVKIILSRKGMTIKELAEIIEKRTGKKMSRQNLTQRLGRDNFQEQDMRMIAEILECPFRLSILLEDEAPEEAKTGEDVKSTKEGEQPKPAMKATKESVRMAKAKARKEKKAKEAERLAEAIEQVPSEMYREPVEREMTLGDYIDIHEELVRQETARLPKVQEEEETVETKVSENQTSDMAVSGQGGYDTDISGETAGEDAVGVMQEEKAVQNTEIWSEESAQEESASEDASEISEPVEVSMNETEPKVDVEELLREMEELEKERELLEQQLEAEKAAKAAKALEEPVHEEKKITGWRAMFQRRTKKERKEELQEEAKIVEQVIFREPTMEELEDDYIDSQEAEAESQEEETAVSESSEVQPTTEELIEELIEEDEDAEDLTRGERNPYTGHEYETNSVRMHPKRIGYVQLYDRRDHGWTDMTEWAFLGYQERKRALLGKDYEPPIYLD